MRRNWDWSYDELKNICKRKVGKLYENNQNTCQKKAQGIKVNVTADHRQRRKIRRERNSRGRIQRISLSDRKKQTKKMRQGKIDYLGSLWIRQEWQKKQHLWGRREATPAKLTKKNHCHFCQKPEYRSGLHPEWNKVLSSKARWVFQPCIGPACLGK